MEQVDLWRSIACSGVGYMNANEIRALVSIDSVDYDPVNNAGMFRYHSTWSNGLFVEDFSNGSVGTLMIIGTQWFPRKVAWVNLSAYAPASNQKDRLISPSFINTQGHRSRGILTMFRDTFRISIAETTLITSLSTASSTISFPPIHEWREVWLDIPSDAVLAFALF